MIQDSMGFYEEPRNGNGIVRSRTTLQLRSWDMPRTQKSLERFNNDIGKAEYPGIYILFAKNNRAYVGEAKRLDISIACHSAVRAGQTMSDSEMRELIRQLEGAAMPHSCPHGRPTMLHITSAYLEREFGRRG